MSKETAIFAAKRKIVKKVMLIYLSESHFALFYPYVQFQMLSFPFLSENLCPFLSKFLLEVPSSLKFLNLGLPLFKGGTLYETSEVFIIDDRICIYFDRSIDIKKFIGLRTHVCHKE